jgi:hypothetical protein
VRDGEVCRCGVALVVGDALTYVRSCKLQLSPDPGLRSALSRFRPYTRTSRSACCSRKRAEHALLLCRRNERFELRSTAIVPTFKADVDLHA